MIYDEKKNSYRQMDRELLIYIYDEKKNSYRQMDRELLIYTGKLSLLLRNGKQDCL